MHDFPFLSLFTFVNQVSSHRHKPVSKKYRNSMFLFKCVCLCMLVGCYELCDTWCDVWCAVWCGMVCCVVWHGVWYVVWRVVQYGIWPVVVCGVVSIRSVVWFVVMCGVWFDVWSV